MIVEKLSTLSVIPVLRNIPYKKSKDIVQALLDGGIHAVEVTMESDRAEAIIRESADQFGDQMLIGAGTVLSVDDCKRAIEAGAQFIVSPALDEEVVTYAVEQGVPVIPGVFTPSEILRAVQLGAAMVKLFPASVLGPGFITDVKGPLGHIEIMATGGITMESAKSYIEAGAIAVGAGGALLRKDLISENDWLGLADEARKWMESVK
ncbi:bifunctional 4-hydroxy-2-oxoglutarate aldolase/2-dehydro-3-deoxy-phosphogluconate aldolase [Jeotgalibacillus sp. S-D1]|uniref:bifunctional 4-hydroxy-2-oxoglutarate aldolase/2-dehydro-3-deoxy-phosphogluconate aldolase n=1 Tax=Jeotgalibacillus sp. S-D1 TaxID=2552189 RepID=UPI001059C69B|nr:bifunctional 4-hydroxy-2-oxoglutarate aldolase/2-dehydro-3-deoxy-phosphogluconate aldolase [Jeotgalibacillus sp. S-D1]TDL34272.1 bifunctional 4-hydroxy-2-oxoglutarate aldolase/2-dehydro-3-deoxy-phosphogluconate aldolase [Jeotgalibacillus sp. S-D1]